MDIEFDEEYLAQLYSEGQAKNKKYRYPKGVIDKYLQTIDKLRVANKIEDLFLIKSLNYEKLRGDRKGLESVRVNQQYRIEFRTTILEGRPESITICSIVALSKHYK